MSIWHAIGVISVLVLIVALGVLSKRQVKNAADFESGGGHAGTAVVAGIILGIILGGSSTIGTAQLAYTNGLSALWFTFGNSAGVFLIALFFAKAYRHAGTQTIIGSIRKEYGFRVGMVVSLLVALGMFINIIAQLMSAVAVLPTIFPGIPYVIALVLAAGLMLAYVVFGGTLSVGSIGQIKTMLIYLGILLSLFIVFRQIGPAELLTRLDHHQYINLFSRGYSKDLGNFFSVILGVVTGQSFVLAAVAADSDATASRAALISSFLIPPVGIASTLIGLFMRAQYPEIADTKNVFSQFVISYFPDLLGGVFLGTLLITIVGTGAGIALAASTIINKDIVSQIAPSFSEPRKSLFLTRASIVVLLTISGCLSNGIFGDTILNFSFMSMALWGVVILAPFLCAYLLPGRISPRWIIISAICSPLLVLLFTLIPVLPFDPLFAGLLFSFLCCVAGMSAKKMGNI